MSGNSIHKWHLLKVQVINVNQYHNTISFKVYKKLYLKLLIFLIILFLILIFPLSVSKPFQLWRNFASQVRLVFSRFQSTTPTPPTVKTRMRIITTTPEPELQFYGALNPIYQTGNF